MLKYADRPTDEDLLIEGREKLRQTLGTHRVQKKGMLYIPKGEFSAAEYERLYVAAYWIDRTPVTNADYARFLQAHPGYPPPFNRSTKELNWRKTSIWSKEYTYPSGQGEHPVVLVSWYDAVEYAKWAGKRLPTWQEWMKAAMGVQGRVFPWGWFFPTPQVCNMLRKGTTPVGLFSPQGDSPYGCVDMAGNVEEWIGDDHGIVLGRMQKSLLGGYTSAAEWEDEYGPRMSNTISGTTADRKWKSIGFRCASDV